MDATRKRKVLLGAVGGLVAVCLIWLVFGRDGNKLREVSGDSRDAQEAMRVLRAVAEDPKSLDAHMTADAVAGVRERVTETVEQMAKAESIEFVSAGWWRGYMRVQVSWPRPEAKPATSTFFLQKEDGELRIRGLQL